MGRVTDHGVGDFSDSIGGIMPSLVGEVGVRGNGIHLNSKSLQGFVLILQVLQLRRANEGEVGGIEANYTPFSFEILFRDIDEIAVAESGRLKREHFFSNQRHTVIPS
ncbi:hypothetical protein D3C71_1801610 [compost metagenome]